MKITELIGNDGGSDYSTDSDQETKIFPPTEEIGSCDVSEIIDKINKKFAENKPIDLTEYPPLYVIHYRGIHYFKSLFPNPAFRRTRRHKIREDKFHESIYSPAIYQLAELPIGDSIDSREKIIRIRQAQRKLSKDFTTLANRPAQERSWWGKKRNHEKLLYQHYQRFVNTYSEFRTENKEKKHECYRVMPGTENPYVSTADEARHAVLYALGAKAESSHGPLRPGYTSNGRAKHPKVGDVQIIVHKLQNLAAKQPLYLSVLQAENKVDIGGRLLNERETTFKGWITAKHIIHTQQIRFPSFNIEFRPAYHAHKYGIKSKSFNLYRRSILDRGRTYEETTLLKKLADHYTTQLHHKAQQFVKDKKGYIVYLGLDGQLRANLPTTMSVRDERRNGRLTGHESWFEYNLSKFLESKSNNDTESDEEFPMLRKQPHLAATACQTGLTCFSQANYADAIHAFSQAIRYDYKNANYHANLALSKYLLNKEDVTAGKDYFVASRLNPEIDNHYDPVFQSYFSDMRLKRAKWFNDQGNLKHLARDEKAAIINYNRAILYDENPFFYVNRALSKYLLNKENITAGWDYFVALQLNPEIDNQYDSTQRSCFSDMLLRRAMWFNHQGNLKHQAGDEKKAIAKYTKAIKYNKDSSFYANRALSKYLLNKEDVTAGRDYSSALRLNPEISNQYDSTQRSHFSDMLLRRAMWFNHKGNLQRQLGDEKKAISKYTQAIALDDKSAYYYMNRAIAKYMLDKNDITAQQDYSQATLLFPSIISNYTDPAFQPIFQHLSHAQTQSTLHLSNFQNIIIVSSNNKTIPNSTNENTDKKSSSLEMGKLPFG